MTGTEENPVFRCLFSAAYMNAAVSKMLDALAGKLRAAAESGLIPEKSAVAVRKVRGQIDNLTKLQLLLSIKIELIAGMSDVQREVEKEAPEEDAAGLLCRGNPGKNGDKIRHVLKGRAIGMVSDKKDAFAGGLAVFEACTYKNCEQSGKTFFSYSAIKGTKMLFLLSADADIEQGAAMPHVNSVKAEGAGIVILREPSKPDVIKNARYVLTLEEGDSTAFEMRIAAGGDKSLDHLSGRIGCRGCLLI